MKHTFQIMEALKCAQRQLDWYAERTVWKDDAIWSSKQCAEALAAMQGMVLVPLEPSNADIKRIAAACRDFYSEDGPYPRAKAARAAMIAPYVNKEEG